jgi:hypothetical protein
LRAGEHSRASPAAGSPGGVCYSTSPRPVQMEVLAHRVDTLTAEPTCRIIDALTVAVIEGFVVEPHRLRATTFGTGGLYLEGPLAFATTKEHHRRPSSTSATPTATRSATMTLVSMTCVPLELEVYGACEPASGKPTLSHRPTSRERWSRSLSENRRLLTENRPLLTSAPGLSRRGRPRRDVRQR